MGVVIPTEGGTTPTSSSSSARGARAGSGARRAYGCSPPRRRASRVPSSATHRPSLHRTRSRAWRAPAPGMSRNCAPSLWPAACCSTCAFDTGRAKSLFALEVSKCVAKSESRSRKACASSHGRADHDSFRQRCDTLMVVHTHRAVASACTRAAPCSAAGAPACQAPRIFST